jgi:TPP-dependent pyruvate/acetoin dehydrogenase alpha subunit
MKKVNGEPNKALKLSMFESMLLIRRFEQRLLELRDQKIARGGVAVSIGQEGIAVGACSAIRREDYITSGHRGHGHALAKGADPVKLLMEFLGRRGGYCHGRGGTMHVCAPEVGLMGTNGIVGAGIPIAVGLGLAAKRTASDRVAVSFFGDGATNTGAFHEALNMASAWKLPVIFICENNLYAISTKISHSTGNDQLWRRGEALGVYSARIDGNAVMDVYEAVRDAACRARAGAGPSFLECMTYRWEGWAWKDRDLGLHYRTMGEILHWQENCPIARLRETLYSEGDLDEEREREIAARIEGQLDNALRLALSSPEPDLADIERDVYA